MKRHKIPTTWRWATLSEIGRVAAGGTPSTKEQRNFGGDVAWLTPKDLSGYEGKYISRGARNLSQRGLETSSAEVLPAGTILFSSRAPIGYTAIAANPIATNQGFKNLILDDGILNEYVYHYLKGNKRLAESHASGTTFTELSAKRFSRIPIPIAPLDQQRRIVDKIEELFTQLDAGVDALKRVQVLLKQYRLSVLKAAVEGRLTEAWRREHGHEVEPASELLERILKERRAKWEEEQLKTFEAKGKKPPKNWKNRYQEPEAPDTSELPELPEGWVWATGEQICWNITSGSTPKSSLMREGKGEIPFIKVYNLTFDGSLDFTLKPTFISGETHRRMSRSACYPGNVLMNIVGPPLGKVSVVPDDFPEWNTNQAVAIFRPFPGLETDFLKVFLTSFVARSWFGRRARATAGQYNLTRTMCRRVPIPLPPTAEQVEISIGSDLISDTIAQALHDVSSASKLCQRLRASVLSCAFSGSLVGLPCI